MSDRLDQLDYYALFSIERGASADAIRAAVHAFARRYHPDRFAAAPEAKRERAETIYRRGAEVTVSRVLLEGRLGSVVAAERRSSPRARPSS